MMKIMLNSVILVMMVLLGPVFAIADTSQSCGEGTVKTGKTYKLNGSGINVRKGPSTKFEKVINEKFSRIAKKTKYITVDNTVTVYEECTKDGWSKVRVTDPDWLRDSHRGWISSNFLRGKKMDSSGKEVFAEADFSFTEKTRPHKSLIIAGVNKVHRENARCKTIDPSSAYISSSKGTKSNPVFYVTCGTGANVFNAFFSKSDVESSVVLREKAHIDSKAAVALCEDFVKQSATHPSTVKFSRVMDLSVRETPNGRTRVTTTFKAKNSFNMELKQKVSCLLDSGGFIEGNISE
jgi:hypothetical protein